MGGEAYKAALDLASSDEAIVAQMDAGEPVTISPLDDGGMNVSCGSESLDIAPEDLAGEDRESMPPPAMPGGAM